MSRTEYEKARKKAQKAYRTQLVRGAWPYLQALDDILSFTDIVSESDLGLTDIPLDAVAGTKTTGRKQAFASNFMPLLDDDTEFARKWSALYNAHIEEGIREPITAVEFMNRFYVAEGNKRVSVLKYVGADSIRGHVTRMLPRKNDSPESRIYYEFLDFYKVTSINYLYFSQEGCFTRLLALLGKKSKDVWSDDEKMDFHSAYIHFSDVFEEKGGRRLSLTTGDAFLIYLEIYGYENLPGKSYRELREEIPAVWKDFELYPVRRHVELVTAPDKEPEGKHLVNRILPLPSPVVRIAFIHDRTPEDSSWTYSHELGRHYLEDALPGRVSTVSYITDSRSEETAEMVKKAIEDGCTILFTTSPKLLNASVRAALKYPHIRILNCSLNSCFGHLRTYYGRMYEAKYLTGILAGILSPEESIGYLADYPIYGSTASINAFALGVRAVKPSARVYLEWSCVKDNRIEEYFAARHISHISGQDLLTPSRGSRQFGLYDVRGGHIQNVAMPVWHWGKFYERIVRSILSGTWKKGASQDRDSESSVNYFWGLSSGMIDVILSNHVPAGAAQLTELVKREISSGAFHPFSGEITSQDGTLRNKKDAVMPEAQIGAMDWLLDNVYGSFPALDTLTDEAKRIVKLQGVGDYQTL